MTDLNVFNSSDELDELSEYAARNNQLATQSSEFLENVEYQGHFLMDNLFQDEDLMYLDPEDVDQLITCNIGTSGVSDESSMSEITPISDKQVSPSSLTSNSDWILLPIPENLQNEPIISRLDSMEVQHAEAPSSSERAQDADKVYTVIRRPPLQMVQQVIKYPAKKAIANVIKPKKCVNKRKQVFEFPREDGVIFMSDGEEERSEPPPKKSLSLSPHEAVIQKPIVLLASPILPSPVKPAIVASFSETPKSSHKYSKIKMKFHTEKGDKCPNCSKIFKRISLHRCKKEPAAEKKIIRLRFKCKICNQMFQMKSALELHNDVAHVSLRCVLCKFMAKTKRGLQLHKISCESSKNLLNIKKEKEEELVVPVLPDVQQKKTIRRSARKI